jgi:cytochrome c biogenesis protein CcmG, thiol:disulfide interchange protein DsbE
MSVTSDGAAGVAEPPAPGRSRPWLRVAIVVAALLFVALLAYGVLSKAPDQTIDETLASGEPVAAPGFSLPLLQRGDPGPGLERAAESAAADGNVSLEELRGTPVVLNFWASWCDPCRAEAEALEEAWGASRDTGPLFVGLNMQDLTGDARAFMSEFDNTYLNVRDESNAVALDWGVTGLPETFFLSAEGEVVAHAIGAISSEQIELGMRAAEEGRPLGAIDGGERRSVE